MVHACHVRAASCARSAAGWRAACSARQPRRRRCSLPARRHAGWRACSPGRRAGGGGSARARGARCRPRWRLSRSLGGTPQPRAGVRPRSRRQQTRWRRLHRPSAPVPCPLAFGGGCAGSSAGARSNGQPVWCGTRRSLCCTVGHHPSLHAKRGLYARPSGPRRVLSLAAGSGCGLQAFSGTKGARLLPISTQWTKQPGCCHAVKLFSKTYATTTCW